MTRSADLQEVTSGPLPSLVSAPAVAAGPRQWPVLCFLHGYDEGPPTELREGLSRHGPLAPHASEVARSEFIVVAPQLPIRGDGWRAVADEVLAVVMQVQEKHQADSKRMYLTGFSFGGNGVFDLALAQPGVWAALWSVDPTRVPRQDPDRPTWLSSGEVSRRREFGFVERLGLESPRRGDPGNRVIVDRGADHVGTATHAYGEERIYRWLLEWNL